MYENKYLTHNYIKQIPFKNSHHRNSVLSYYIVCVLWKERVVGQKQTGVGLCVAHLDRQSLLFLQEKDG